MLIAKRQRQRRLEVSRYFGRKSRPFVVALKRQHKNNKIYISNWFFFQASSFQLLKLENLLRWSFFTLIYNRSSKMNYFIYFTSKQEELYQNKVNSRLFSTYITFKWLENSSCSMSCNFLALSPPALKNRTNRAQSIDSLSLANSTPEQSPKTSRLMLSAKAKKITPSSSANVTPDQSPKTSVHRLTAHCKNTMLITWIYSIHYVVIGVGRVH